MSNVNHVDLFQDLMDLWLTLFSKLLSEPSPVLNVPDSVAMPQAPSTMLSTSVLEAPTREPVWVTLAVPWSVEAVWLALPPGVFLPVILPTRLSTPSSQATEVGSSRQLEFKFKLVLYDILKLL